MPASCLSVGFEIAPCSFQLFFFLGLSGSCRSRLNTNNKFRSKYHCYPLQTHIVQIGHSTCTHMSINPCTYLLSVSSSHCQFQYPKIILHIIYMINTARNLPVYLEYCHHESLTYGAAQHCSQERSGWQQIFLKRGAGAGRCSLLRMLTCIYDFEWRW